jgi:hypothetical protein
MEFFDALDQTVDAPVVWPNYHVDMDDPPPPHQLVASHDLVRTDQSGRRYIVVPKGQPPDSRVRLTEEEEATLVEPPPSLRRGHLHRGPYGFSLEGVVIGEWEDGCST